jgi:molecular chaperone HtpG
VEPRRGRWGALEDACREGLGFEPLDAFPVSAPAGGVRGYLFIRPGAAGRWDGRHKLYARGMFVSDHVHGLLPPWATFVGACLNSSGLRLTASRESLHQGEALAATSEELGAAVRARLVHLMRSDPGRFAAVMAVHDTEIRGLAVKDPDFFAVIIDLLEFETTLGPVRFGEFRRDNETVLVARTAEQYRRLATIAEPLGIRVFNGGYTYHEELLTRAAQRWPELNVRGYDTSDLADELPEPGDPGRFEGLADAGAEALGPHGCGVVVRDFAPESSPAFFALGLDAEYHRQLDRTKAMSSELWTVVLDAMAPRPEVVSPTRLCLNARSPLICRLAGTADPGLQRTAVEILYVQALMAGQHALTSGELDLLHRGMERLLDRAVTPKGAP